jgi:hypothetical protein
MVGQLIEQIVGGGKENLLRAVPFGIAMDSHVFLNIAQFGDLSNRKAGTLARG